MVSQNMMSNKVHRTIIFLSRVILFNDCSFLWNLILPLQHGKKDKPMKEKEEGKKCNVL